MPAARLHVSDGITNPSPPYATDEKFLRAHHRKVAPRQPRSGLQEMPQARGRWQKRQTRFKSRTQGQVREGKPAPRLILPSCFGVCPKRAVGRERRYVASWRIRADLGSQLDAG